MSDKDTKTKESQQPREPVAGVECLRCGETLIFGDEGNCAVDDEGAPFSHYCDYCDYMVWKQVHE